MTAPIPSKPNRVQVSGVSFHAVRDREAVGYVLESLNNGCGGWVQTPNLDHLRRFSTEPHLARFRNSADLILADGTPVVWASRLQGTPLPGRVAGSDLIWTMAEGAAAAGRTVYLLGGNPGVADQASCALSSTFPGIKVVGTYSPPFGFENDPDEIFAVMGRLAACEPDIVFVGLPFPKAELLIEAAIDSFPRSWFLALGASLSFVAGDVPRAPAWTHRSGLEWIWRLAQEPRRLYHRYLVAGLPFAIRLFIESFRQRLSSEP